MDTPEIEFQDDSQALDFQVAVDKFYQILESELPEFTQLFSNPKKQKMMFYAALRSINALKNNKVKLIKYLKTIGDKHKMLGLSHYHMEIGRLAFEQAVLAGGEKLTPDQRLFYINSYVEIEKAMGF